MHRLIILLSVLPFGAIAARAAPMYCDMQVNQILDQNLYISKIFDSTESQSANARKFTEALNRLVPGVPASRQDPASCITFASASAAQEALAAEMQSWHQVNSKPAIELNWP